MNTKILNEIGFSEAEKKVYISLLELGSSTAAPILKKTGLQNSVLYRTIHRLIEKGFISFIKKGKIKHYKSTDPELLLTFLKEKEKRLKEIIPELKLKQTQSEKEDAEVYSGIKGVKTLLYSLIEESKKGEESFFFQSGSKIYTELQDKIFLAYDQLRKEKDLDVKGILHISTKKLMKKGRYSKMRYVDFPIPSNISIFNDYVGLTAFEDKPMCLLIKSRVLATVFRNYFESVWKN